MGKGKHIAVIGDGMADYPIAELGGRTPLEVAETPNLDFLAANGRMGLIKTIPDGMPPDSVVANLSILGYDPSRYNVGRGPLEAAAMGIDLGPNDVAFRCNLVTEDKGRLIDYSAGHVSTEEAAQLLKEVQKFGIGEFHVGVSYRHVFVLRGVNVSAGCSPPHDIMGEPISKHLMKVNGDKIARRLNEFMLASKDVLSRHPVNLKRIKQGKNPANMIWLWSPGKRPKWRRLDEKYGVKGALISAVDLIKGMGVFAGLDIIKVPGATGYLDTNYEGKADYALRALKKNDLIYVHVEAPDEAGHSGVAEQKVKAIEDLDKRLVGRILNKQEDCTVAVLPDHATPISVRTHVPDPVPFAIYSPGKKGDGLSYTEACAKKGSFGLIDGKNFMGLFLKQ